MLRCIFPLVLSLIALFSAVDAAKAQVMTNGLLLWLDSSQRSSVITNTSGSVLEWTNIAPGATNAVMFTGTDDNSTVGYNTTAPTYVSGFNGIGVVNFNGLGYLDTTNFSAATPASITIFMIANTTTNPGSYSAFMAFRSSPTANDYDSGLNFDQGLGPTRGLDILNVEGAKAGGAGGYNYETGTLPFGKFHLFEIDYGSGPSNNDNTISLNVDGTPMNSSTANPTAASLQNLFIGTRAYASGNNQGSSHNLTGQIAAVLVYNHQISVAERNQVQGYFLTYFATNNLTISPFGVYGAGVAWTNAASTLVSTTNLMSTWSPYAGLETTNNGKVSAVIPQAPAQFFRLKN